MKTIKNEWKNIFGNKLMLVSFVVICFIPILYAAFFLRSIWDPYGKTENLPVAVVNEDIKYNFKGKDLNIGQELENELRNNNSLGWDFVDAKTAQNGLENQKYYMVLTLPNDFSKNAASVLNEKPRQMEIKYETNASLNYLGEVVSDTAAVQLQSQVSNQVTTAYISTMMEQAGKAKEGFNMAANGASKLSDGSGKVLEGGIKLNSNLNTLAQSTILFNNGSTKFNVGLDKYLNGVKTLSEGANTLDKSVGMLISNLPTLNKGVVDLNHGSSKLDSGIIDYTNAVGEIHSNSNMLNQKNNELKFGMNKLNSSFTSIDKLSKASGSVNQGLQSIAQTAPNNAAEVASGLTTLNTNLQALSNASGKSEQATANIANDIDNARFNLNNLKSNNSTINTNAIINNLQTNKALSGLSNEDKQAILVAIESEINNQNITVDDSSLINLENSLNKIEKTNLNQPKVTNEELQTAINEVATSANELLPKATNIVKQSEATSKVISNQLIPTMAQVDGGLVLLNNSSTDINTLSNGVNQYLDTNLLLSDGINKLNQNSAQLKAGSTALNDGITTINKKTPELVRGASLLKEGTKKLSDGSSELNKNSSTLSAGSKQIVDTTTKLVLGSVQLNEGSAQLTNALTTLNNGSDELASKLNKGASTLNNVKINDDNIKMIASPDKLVHDKYSDVPNYGHALAPYVLSLALYVGCLIFNFIMPIRKVAYKKATTLDWWASKVSLGVVGAIIMALVEAGVMILLGLEPIFLAKYFIMALVTALAYMFIIMFLAVSFDNPGRFVAMVLLVLQLAASGGTFPMPLTSNFFNAIHKFLPMTHSIDGFRQVISSGLGNEVYTSSIFILLTLMIVFAALMYVSMHLLMKHHNDNVSQLDDNQKTLDTNYSYNN